MQKNKKFMLLYGAIVVVSLLVILSKKYKIEEISEQGVQKTEGVQEDGKEPLSKLDTVGYDVEASKGDGKPVILMFGASWCPPCKQMRPSVESIFEKYSDQVTIRYVDVDKADTELMGPYPLEVVPTQFFFDAEKNPLEEAEYMGEGTGWILRADSPDRETQKHILTGHQGYMSEEAIEMIIESWGIKETK